MEVTGRTKIYRKDFDGHPAYSRIISSRKYENGQKGDWNKPLYVTVKFPYGTQIADGTVVNITKSFESSYENRAGEVKPMTVVQEFTIEGTQTAQRAEDSYTALTNDDIPF